MIRRWGTWVLAGHILVVAASSVAGVATVTIDRVAVGPGGAHQVWISVLDGNGQPLAAEKLGELSVKEDGEAITHLAVRSYSARFPKGAMAVVVDPWLLTPEHRARVVEMVRVLRGKLSAHDRLRIVSAARGFPSEDVSDAGNLDRVDRLLKPGAAEEPPLIIDALFREMKRAREEGRSRGSVLLVVTASPDLGSKTNAIDVFTLLRNENRPSTVALLVAGDSIPAKSLGPLSRIAGRSGGGITVLHSGSEIAQAAVSLLERARGSFLLQYHPLNWDPHRSGHKLSVSVRVGNGVYVSEKEFATEDVSVDPWWASSGVWAAIVLLLMLGATVYALGRQRCLCRLEIESGEERGCMFEVLRVPITIGAMEGNDLVLDERRVSRNHAILDRRFGHFELLDLNSEHGTFVNGHRITSQRLVRGDRIRIGSDALRFEGR